MITHFDELYCLVIMRDNRSVFFCSSSTGSSSKSLPPSTTSGSSSDRGLTERESEHRFAKADVISSFEIASRSTGITSCFSGRSPFSFIHGWSYSESTPRHTPKSHRSKSVPRDRDRETSSIDPCVKESESVMQGYTKSGDNVDGYSISFSIKSSKKATMSGL